MAVRFASEYLLWLLLMKANCKIYDIQTTHDAFPFPSSNLPSRSDARDRE